MRFNARSAACDRVRDVARFAGVRFVRVDAERVPRVEADFDLLRVGVDLDFPRVAVDLDLPRVEAALRLAGRDLLLRRLSGMSTPARRASDNPMAIAWRAFFAPCSPPRILSISALTNSPAWVLADLPARLSRFARSMVDLSGMNAPRAAMEPP